MCGHGRRTSVRFELIQASCSAVLFQLVAGGTDVGVTEAIRVVGVTGLLRAVALHTLSTNRPADFLIVVSVRSIL